MKLKKHSAATTVVATSAHSGTPLRVTRPNTAGALPSRARLYSMRVAAYMPELPADSTEVSTTAFMTEAAASRPARSKISAKGLTLTSVTSAQQLRIGIGNEQADDQDGHHVEQQDAPKHLAHRARQVARGILGFAGRDADEFGALKGKAHHHGHADQRRETARERRVAHGPVGQAAGRRRG